MIRRAGRATNSAFRWCGKPYAPRPALEHGRRRAGPAPRELHGPASAAMEKAIAEATAVRQPRGVVLDLRGNPGGLFRQAVMMADAFLSEGEIVSLRGRTAANQRTWQADPAELLAGVPMVVLIDGALRVGLGARRRGAPGKRPRDRHGAAELRQGQRPDHRLAGRRQGRAAPDHRALSRSVRTQRAAYGRRPRHRARCRACKYHVARRREADRAQALPGADEPLPPKARVEQSRCAAAQANADPALACALVFLDAGGIEPFLAALDAERSGNRLDLER